MISLLDSGFSDEKIEHYLGIFLSKHGTIARRSSGMCGLIYFFDQGENVHPRWVVAKLPKNIAEGPRERDRRFLREIQLQHGTFYHRFVAWPFDYRTVFNVPVALYKAEDGDLAQWLPRTIAEFSSVSRLALLIYLCSALRHCRSRGIQCHQDLKPQNILVDHISRRLRDVPSEDVFVFPKLADFGLANLSIDDGNAEGARPYMAPEQWLEGRAIPESDVFALGVIIFEVMTQGIHPIGGVTREWWPQPSEGKSKKWTRPEIWIKWAERGAPVQTAEFLVEGAESLARACMAANPDDRPTIDHIQAELGKILYAIDSKAADQATFQASVADDAGQSDEWPHRDMQLRKLKARFDESE